MEGKRSDNDISENSAEEDNDKTPTNEKDSGNDSVTPDETINDITDMKNTLEHVKRAIVGKHVDKKVMDDIKEEYNSYFYEDSGNSTEKESLDDIKNYLESELSIALNKASLDGLSEALEKVLESSNKTSPNESSNKVTSSESSASEASTSTAKPSDGLSPLDHIIEKQSTDPIDIIDPD